MRRPPDLAGPWVELECRSCVRRVLGVAGYARMNHDPDSPAAVLVNARARLLFDVRVHSRQTADLQRNERAPDVGGDTITYSLTCRRCSTTHRIRQGRAFDLWAAAVEDQVDGARAGTPWVGVRRSL